MSVVTGALGSITPKLLQLLHDEYKLQKGVKNQVQWLSNELESVYTFIGKVADVPWDHSTSKSRCNDQNFGFSKISQKI